MPGYGFPDAQRDFGEFAKLEPKLWGLWELCRRAAPPTKKIEIIDDSYDSDPYETDPIATDKPDDGWCAETYLWQNVMSELLVLVGIHRRQGPPELQTREAFETVYRILREWALPRSCACCANDDNDGPWHGGDRDHPTHRDRRG